MNQNPGTYNNRVLQKYFYHYLLTTSVICIIYAVVIDSHSQPSYSCLEWRKIMIALKPFYLKFVHSSLPPLLLKHNENLALYPLTEVTDIFNVNFGRGI